MSYLRITAAALALGAMPLAAPAVAKDPPIKVSQGQAAKGQTNIVVGAFNIGFIFQSVDRAGNQNQGGMLGAFGGTTKATSKLVGVTPEMMQAITDAAYEDFKAQMVAKGYTVAEPAGLFGSAEMAKAKETPAPYKVDVTLEKGSKGESFYYKPTALARQYFIPGDVTMDAGGMFGGFKAMGPGMQAAQVQLAMANYAKASGVAVVDVTYLIDFSQQKRPGAFSFSGVQVNSGMSVVDEFSKMTLIAPSGKATTIMIKQPVAVEGEFADVSDKTKGAGGQKAFNVAGGLIAARFGIGGIGMGKRKTFEFAVKPDQYTPGATKAATLANALVVEQLAALR